MPPIRVLVALLLDVLLLVLALVVLLVVECWCRVVTVVAKACVFLVVHQGVNPLLLLVVAAALEQKLNIAVKGSKKIYKELNQIIKEKVNK